MSDGRMLRMARPLRIELAGGWHHVMNRAHRDGALFLDDTNRRRFMGLVAELPERFAVEAHAFVLVDNHCHLSLKFLAGLFRSRAHTGMAIDRCDWESLRRPRAEVVKTGEAIRGEASSKWADRYGDWGRPHCFIKTVRH